MLSTILWLSLTIYHEARSQEQLDQIAIGHVIMNRAKVNGKLIKEVVLQDKQFSCYNNGIKFPNNPKAFIFSIETAIIVLHGKDFTGGAKYYHTKKVKPIWRKGLNKIGSFGDHVFYKEIEKIKAIKMKRIL